MKLDFVKEVKLTVPHELHIHPQMDADLLGVRTKWDATSHPSPTPKCHSVLHVFSSLKTPVTVSHCIFLSPAPMLLLLHLLWPR